MAHETGFGSWSGGAKAYNPAGIKTANAHGDTTSDFEKPTTPDDGAHLLYNHWGSLLAYDPISPVHGRYSVAKKVYQGRGVYGNITKVNQLGNGVWATDPNYANKITKYLSELEGKTPTSNIDQAIQKGFDKASQYIGTFYATWAPGKDWTTWPNLPLPSVAQAKSQGGICTSVTNVYRLINGLSTPEWTENGVKWVKGGTGAWGKQFSLHKFVLGKWYPKGTLFIELYSGTDLNLQGHVSVSIEDGTNPKLIQAYLSQGWNANDRLADTHSWAKFVTYALPEEWLV